MPKNLALFQKGYRGDLLTRILDLSALNPTTGCWEWIGAVVYSRTQGVRYPKMTYEGKTELAHRVVLAAIKLEVPLAEIKEFEACHTCDVSLCVCPDHVYKGTHSQNIKDTWQRSRSKG